MTDLEQRLRIAMEHAAPNDPARILSSCTQLKGQVIPMKHTNRKRIRQSMLATAAVLAFMVCGGLGLHGWNSAHAVASVVSLDVNPSIQLEVNAREKILSAEALNEEGRVVLDDMDLTDAHLNVAVNAIVGSLLRNGYLDSLSSTILISVEDRDVQRAARLETALSAEVDAALQHASAGAAILTQTVEKNTALEAQAHNSSISVGKAALIEKVRSIAPELSFESLSALSVEELKQLAETGAPGLPIGIRAAIEVAEAAAIPAAEHKFGRTLSPEEIRREAEPELDEKPPHYEVELETALGSLEYTVQAYTGEILSGLRASEQKEPEAPKTGTAVSPAEPVVTPPVPAEKPAAEKPGAPAVKPAEQPAKQDKPSPQATKPAESPAKPTMLDRDAAKAAALAHAGVSADEVRKLECELDREDGAAVYEIEFKAGSMEYEYEVDAATGAILKAEREHDD